MTSEKGSKRDKNQNIQVFVRLRPLNQRERDIKSLGVVEVVNAREVVVRSQQSIHTKKFTFDRAFGPNVKQVEVYQQVVSPLIEEVLCGYNCTVFAYGQTGTGKTHTMVGESTGDETTWQNDPLAGIIPRALSQLFDELRISNTEYTVRVSYLELYNEELFDLLASSDDNSKLRIYEDVTRKGANIVNGLEEITVHNKNEVYKIMAQGQERKRVASTLMNAQSSRSHTVFTIVVHMKENGQEGEELVKIGKLNLVDLAGSENISKAGSDNPAKRERARECVNINQSLLTLGRVITALVERHPHIPYRESKLTRILQESLGGRTKTSIIATISPGHKDMEETLSTLEYAHRAKNIQNKPEINQKMTKKAIIKEFVDEIDKLKRDLQAARDKNGIYLASDTFTEMTLKDEEQRKEIQELLLKKRAMEEEKERKESALAELSRALHERASELRSTRGAVRAAREQLLNTNNLLQTTKLHYEEQKHLVSKQRATEQELSAQARDILAAAGAAADHARRLHDTVDRRKTVESTNLQVTQTYRQQAAQLRANMAAGTQHIAESLDRALTSLHEHTDNHTTTSTQCLEENRQKLDELVEKLVEAMSQAKSSSASSQSSLSSLAQQHRAAVLQAASAQSAGARAALLACVQLASAARRHAADWGAPKALADLVEAWLSDGQERVSSLRRSHAAVHARCSAEELKRGDTYRRQRDAKKQRAVRAGEKVVAALAQLEAEKVQLENRLTKQLSDIEQERLDTESRLSQWMDEERALLEERLARRAAAERAALEHRLAGRRAELEQERQAVEERVRSIEVWKQEQLAALEEENQIAETYLTECEAGRENCLQHLNAFQQLIEEGTTALSADLSEFSARLVQVSEQRGEELLQRVAQTAHQVEQEATTEMSSEEQRRAHLVASADAALQGVLGGNASALDAVVQTWQTVTDASVSSLRDVSTATNAVATAAHAACAQHDAAVQSARQRVEQFCGDMQRALAQQDEMERARLGDEFRVYEPTGSTPARQEFRLPRALAATSPHERILARFRAMRRNSCEEPLGEVCAVESDPEARASDADSCASDDSAFTTPPNEGRGSPICKSTSETELYYRKPAGKENPQYRPVSHKKASRLPAPASHKKPLIERN